MKTDNEDATSKSNATETIDRFRAKVISLLPENMRELYAHEKLLVPLNEVLQKLSAQGYLDNHHTAMEALAYEAELQAMAASITRREIQSARSARALDLMVEAWNRLHDVCLLESNEEA